MCCNISKRWGSVIYVCIRGRQSYDLTWGCPKHASSLHSKDILLGQGIPWGTTPTVLDNVWWISWPSGRRTDGRTDEEDDDEMDDGWTDVLVQRRRTTTTTTTTTMTTTTTTPTTTTTGRATDGRIEDEVFIFYVPFKCIYIPYITFSTVWKYRKYVYMRFKFPWNGPY